MCAVRDRGVAAAGEVALVECGEHCRDAGVEGDVFSAATGEVLAVGAFDVEAFGSVCVGGVAVLCCVECALGGAPC